MRTESIPHGPAVSRAFRPVLMCLAALAILAFGGVQAQAQELINNINKTVSGYVQLATATARAGQAFTTDGKRYQLSSVVLPLSLNADSGGNPIAFVQLVGSNGSGQPADPYVALATSGTGAVDATYGPARRFDLSYNLSPNTTYWIMLGGALNGYPIRWEFTLDETYTGAATIPSSPASAFTNDPAIYSNWQYYPLSFGPQIFVVRYSAITAIELSAFAADLRDNVVNVDWQTSAETDNVGFHLWRSDAADGVYTRITNQLIPATGSTAQGGVYSFTDADVLHDGTYFYKLEDVDTADVSTFNGPVQADMSSISLIAPTGDEAVPAQYRARFSWKSAPYMQFRVQFSNLEDFSAGVLTLPITPNPSFKRVALRQGFSITPSVGRWRKIKRLSGTDRTLYWRVVGKEENGTLRPSAAGILRIR